MFKKLKEQWLRLAHFLGRINTAILLTVVYLAVITPIGLLFRAFGRSPLRGKGSGSSWIEHPGASGLDKPF
jgi:hypothetical protein